MYNTIKRLLFTTAACLSYLYLCSTASAYITTITAGTKMIYFRVGDGAWTGAVYNSGGTPANGGAISMVQASVPAAQIGDGTAVDMTVTAGLTSNIDGFALCNANQLYIGGFYRTPTTAANATVSVTAPPFLLNGQGGQIASSQISWTSSGNGDGTTAQPFPAGSFTGSYQVLANNFARNSWRESCHSFKYANTGFVPEGTYNMRVTYTLAAP